jgi:psiF repeat
MKTSIILLSGTLALSAVAFTTSAFSEENTNNATSQRQKFADCAHQSKGLKGDEHKKFMSDCLSGKTHEMKADAAANDSADKGAMKPKSSPRDAKMKACKTEAKSKKLSGDERKAFLSECMQDDDN